MTGCGAPVQDGPVALAPGATVVDGTVTLTGEPVPGAYVRLHDASGEFTAEVVTGPTGTFTFYARPAAWELRVLSRAGNTSVDVDAAEGRTTVAVPL
ncbi:DUF1416 domain-containing protein [Sanguibacter sp. HDW7]|uniref:DUF1416 domain-containing protein n=1 Tax=Sanguibacter sp. HDW7 TaxID=2714931 RepID=UPI00140AD1D1|nr:DUF1416 domain-containing protein [Sanguibacter sp. HDW7]QIK83645.1 DUF1416 domain-containing protein [Sanguibacter sp. HDW7]